MNGKIVTGLIAMPPGHSHFSLPIKLTRMKDTNRFYEENKNIHLQ